MLCLAVLGSDVSIPMSKSPTTASLPFTPVTLVFRNLKYVVPTDHGNKTLLEGISGFCKPGTLTALMGASGETTAATALLSHPLTLATFEGVVFAPVLPFVSCAAVVLPFRRRCCCVNACDRSSRLGVEL